MMDYQERQLYAKHAQKALKPYLGKTVKLNIRLLDKTLHEEAMYAGKTAENDGGWAEFITAREESLGGVYSFNGYWAHLWDIESMGGDAFTVDNSDREDPNPLTFTDNKKRLEEMLKMWKKREK